jgi:hypothetical protein
LHALDGLHQILPPETDPNAFDHVEPMQRLPLLLPAELPLDGTSPPWSGPFCHCNSDDLTYLKAQFAALPTLRVGLDLGTNPDAALAEMLAPMFKAIGVTIVTLSALGHLEPLFDGIGLEIAQTNHPETMATLVQALELIVCVDALPAHIAGAMGVQCHLLLPLQHEALWGASGDKTNWYPSMQLYRQCPQNGWQPNVETLQHRLAAAFQQEAP